MFDAAAADADLTIAADRDVASDVALGPPATTAAALFTSLAIGFGGRLELAINESTVDIPWESAAESDELAAIALEVAEALCDHAGAFVSNGVVSFPTMALLRPEEEAKTRVLVVEDNPTNQLLASKQLERLGVEPVIAPTGEHGVELARREAFRLILMDWNLPDIDGLEATRQIREHGASSDSPIVAMTANAMAGDRQACLDAGMNDVLTKPVRMEAIREVVTTWTAAEQKTDPVALGHRLSVDLGGSAVARSVTAAFLEELDMRVNAILSEDGEDRKRAAHTLKSTAALLALDGLSEICADVELGRSEPDELRLRREAETARTLLRLARSALDAA